MKTKKSAKDRSTDRAKVQTLLKKVPDSADFLLNIITFQIPAEQESHHIERSAAIVGASYVEHALRIGITRQLPKDDVDPALNYLFEGESGTLRAFGSKIRIAKALGIVSGNMYDDLENIRHIRNMFAHSMDTVSFNDQIIQKLCSEFSIIFPPYREPIGYFAQLRTLVLDSPMYRYARAADLYYLMLTQDPKRAEAMVK